MTFQEKVLFALLIALITYCLWSFSCIVENFQEEESITIKIKNLTDEVNAYMTTAGDILCPTYEEILKSLAENKSGSDSEKRLAAVQEIQSMAGGPLFPCPLPKTAFHIPADIGTRLERTLKFFKEQLDRMLSAITQAADCPPKQVEGFYVDTNAAICTDDLANRRKDLDAKAQLDSEARQCILVDSLSDEEKIQLLEIRQLSLSQIMPLVSTTNALAEIGQKTQELKTVKQRMTSGTFSSSCST